MEKTCLKWRDALSSVPRHRRSMAESSQCKSSVPLMTLRKRTRSSDVVKVLDIDPNIVLINCHESDKGHLYWTMANVMAIFFSVFWLLDVNSQLDFRKNNFQVTSFRKVSYGFLSLKMTSYLLPHDVTDICAWNFRLYLILRSLNLSNLRNDNETSWKPPF